MSKEQQYAPELLPYVKMAVDRDHKPGQFWLTSAQQFHLMKGISESLAGRVGGIHLLVLSKKELTGQGRESGTFLPKPDDIQNMISTGSKLMLKEIYRMIWCGAFPAIALDEKMDRDLFYSSYVQTYLQRDIHDTHGQDAKVLFPQYRSLRLPD